MIPIFCNTAPHDNDSLVEAVTNGLATVFRLESRHAVCLTGTFPSFDAISIDLSGAEVDLASPPGNGLGTGRRQPAFTAKQFSIVGRPIKRIGATVDMELHGSDMRFDFDRNCEDQSVLVLVEASGTLRLDLTHDSLQTLLLEGLREVAAKQSIEVERTDVTLVQLDARSLEIQLRISATKRAGFLPVRGVLVVSGRLEVDDALVAKVSELSCHGEGIVGSLITPLVRPKLDDCNGKTFSLASLPLGDLALHDLELDTSSNRVNMEAIFGKVASADHHHDENA